MVIGSCRRQDLVGIIDTFRFDVRPFLEDDTGGNRNALDVKHVKDDRKRTTEG